jgi:hypothetical protein
MNIRIMTPLLSSLLFFAKGTKGCRKNLNERREAE